MPPDTVFTANHLTDTESKTVQEKHRLNTTQKSKQCKIQQNKTTHVQLPFTTLGQVTTWGLFYKTLKPTWSKKTLKLVYCKCSKATPNMMCSIKAHNDSRRLACSAVLYTDERHNISFFVTATFSSASSGGSTATIRASSSGSTLLQDKRHYVNKKIHKM